jgi:hypothetical protein
LRLYKRRVEILEKVIAAETDRMEINATVHEILQAATGLEATKISHPNFSQLMTRH